MLIYWQFVIDFELSGPALTSEPAGVDVVRPVVLVAGACLLYTSPSPRDGLLSRMPSSA